jgi:alcohol dehydrogenase class IV
MPSERAVHLQLSLRYDLGCGYRTRLGAVATRLGIRRPLVVTDPGVAAQPWYADALRSLADADLTAATFDDIRTNPTLPSVDRGVDSYRAHRADGLVLIGGGSAMDTGKAIALAATHDRPLFDYELAHGSHYKEIRGDRLVPMVAMPTTSGSGSEVSPGAVITDRAAGVKRTLLHPALTPAAVIADPEVTFGLPAALTAGTGMDALTHAVEALCSPVYHPLADGAGLEAIRIIAGALPIACREPGDAAARTDMMMAASMAAVAFQKGLGLVHAMAHPLGAALDLHHGLANAILLPYVLAFNRTAAADPLARMARALGLPATDYPAVRDWLLALRAEVGIPHRLDGCAPDTIGALSTRAAGERAYLRTNPRPANADQIAEIYRAAIAGDV